MEPSTRRHCEFVTIGARGRFTDIGPDDHGALFDLAFPEIDPCEPVTFTLSYQAGTSSAMAKDALELVDADAWSLRSG